MGGRLIHEVDLYTIKYGISLKNFQIKVFKGRPPGICTSIIIEFNRKVNLAGFEFSGPKLLYATLANFFPPWVGFHKTSYI